MKLSKCTYGKLVTNGEHVGMIVGITNNIWSANERDRDDIARAIPLVQWSGGRTSGIHHDNITEFKD